MSSITSIHWVYEHSQSPDLVLVDCRFTLGKPGTGREAYETGHLPGAVYFDLEKDLSAPVGEHGGRHPLPDIGTLSEKLGRAGIGENTRVIAYDDQGGAMASRFWWILRYLGHRHVCVMDQGFAAWQAAGYPVTVETPDPAVREFKPHVQRDWLLDHQDVLAKLHDPDRILIDSREARRYAGLEEPLDAVAGHIPGAVNRFWREAIDADGHWKKGEEQKKRFEGIPVSKEIVVYCGSGVTACPNILALMEAGYGNVKLYGGSWSDWISYRDHPIATEKE